MNLRNKSPQSPSWDLYMIKIVKWEKGDELKNRVVSTKKSDMLSVLTIKGGPLFTSNQKFKKKTLFLTLKTHMKPYEHEPVVKIGHKTCFESNWIIKFTKIGRLKQINLRDPFRPKYTIFQMKHQNINKGSKVKPSILPTQNRHSRSYGTVKPHSRLKSQSIDQS